MTCVPPSRAAPGDVNTAAPFQKNERTCGKDVVVPSEPFGVSRAQIPLGEPRGDKV